MRNRTNGLQRRIKHFRWVVEQLSQSDKVFYLEKDWYDPPTLVIKADAQKEAEQAELALLQKKSKSIWESMLRLFC